ncbi:MAG: serine/threonine protein kinase, partial [Bryobacteraceae bacterium]
MIASTTQSVTASIDTLSSNEWRSAEAPFPAPMRIGSYRLIRQIGAGGMGAVYLAWPEDGRPGQRVAVKVVTSSPEPDWVQDRLHYEREVLGKLEHTNIARLLGGGTCADGTPYLVMEYVDGLAIDRYCRERRLTIASRLELFLGVCEAVSYANRNGVVHCDLKPGNILVTGDGAPKLLDFGIARVLEPGRDCPCSGALRMMTPQYASPEQARGGTITTATDIYSLGVVLHELLAGERPLRCVTRRGASQGLPRGLARVVRKAMRRDPERRYSFVEQLMTDIRRYLS